MDRSSFEFQKFCFLCGEECIVDMDPKHPDRFEQNPGVMCKTAHRGKSKDGKQEMIQRSYRGGKNVYYLSVFQEAKIINQVGFEKKEEKGLVTILLSPLFYRYAMNEEIY